MCVRIRSFARAIVLAIIMAMVYGDQLVSAQRNDAGRTARASTKQGVKASNKPAKEGIESKAMSRKSTVKSKTSSRKRKPSKATSTRRGAKARSTARRLPKYFARLMLSDEQRDKVYDIQAKYLKQIAQLEERIENLRAKMR